MAFWAPVLCRQRVLSLVNVLLLYPPVINELPRPPPLSVSAATPPYPGGQPQRGFRVQLLGQLPSFFRKLAGLRVGVKCSEAGVGPTQGQIPAPLLSNITSGRFMDHD